MKFWHFLPPKPHQAARISLRIIFISDQKMDSTPGKVGLCLGILVFVVIFEVVLGEILFDASQDFIPWL